MFTINHTVNNKTTQDEISQWAVRDTILQKRYISSVTNLLDKPEFHVYFDGCTLFSKSILMTFYVQNRID